MINMSINQHSSHDGNNASANKDVRSAQVGRYRKVIVSLLSASAILSLAVPVVAQVTIDGGIIEIVDGTGVTTTQPAPFAVAWPVGDELTIGDVGSGELQIINGGEVSNTIGVLGESSSAIGVVTVAGAGSIWNNSSVLFIGENGRGTLNIEDGGAVFTTHALIGTQANAVGFATVTGPGSTLVTDSGVEVGVIGNGTLLIENGGTITSNSAAIGSYSGSTGAATVTGAGSLWEHQILAVGGNGNGTLRIEDGGAVHSLTGFISASDSAIGDMTVTGDGSNWLNQGLILVGYLGDGALTIADGGLVQTNSGVSIGQEVGSTGTLNIGAASGAAAVAAGTLSAYGVVFGEGDASIVFNHSGTDYDFDTSITGAGEVNVESGTTIFSTNHDYSGDTIISGGTLLVNGSVTSDIYVNGTGSFGGTGSVGNLFVQSGGTLAPGNSIGTIFATHAGFASGSSFDVEIDAAGQSDFLVVAGDVVIDAGATLNITPEMLGDDGSSYDWTTTYLLIAANSVSGMFDTVTETFSELDIFSVTYEIDRVLLTLISHDIDITSAAATANQLATAEAIDALAPTSPIYEAITLAGTENAPMAFDLLSGEIHPTTQTLLALNSTFAFETAFDHDSVAGVDVWGVFAGSWSQINGDGTAVTAKQSIFGAFAGADIPVAESVKVGIVAGITNANFDAAARASNGSADAFHIGGYGQVSLGAVKFGLGGLYSSYDLATCRTVNIVDLSEVLTASYAASSVSFYGEASRAFELQNLTLEPFVHAAHVALKTDAIAETGGAAALSTDAATHSLTLATLGLRVNREIYLSGLTANLSGSIGWQHGFGDLDTMSDMSFDGQPAFTIAGVSAARNAVTLSVGIDIDLGSNFGIAMAYKGQLAGDVQSHRAQLTISKDF